MQPFGKADRLLGILCLIAALLILFVWVPLDTETGIAEKVRRKWAIGDALAPTLAGSVIALGALLTIIRPISEAPGLERRHFVWMLWLLGLFVLSFGLMRYLGPVAAAVLTEEGYRPLRNTVPWKYVGYVAGGTVMIAGLSLLVRRRIGLTDIIVAVLASVLIALAYDLPFDDLLLPPNGDV